MFSNFATSMGVFSAIAAGLTANAQPPDVVPVTMTIRIIGIDEYRDQAFVVRVSDLNNPNLCTVQVKNSKSFEVRWASHRSSHGLNFLTIFSMPRQDFDKLMAGDPKLNTLRADTPGVLTSPKLSLGAVRSGYRVTINDGKLSATKVEDEKQKSGPR